MSTTVKFLAAMHIIIKSLHSKRSNEEEGSFPTLLHRTMTDHFLNQYVVTDCGETGKVVKARPRKGIEGYVIRLLVEKLFTNEWYSKEETKAAIARYASSSKGIAVSVMVMHSGFLHWSDAVALGSASRSTHEAWKQTRDVYLRPLLGVLESMVGRKPEDNKWTRSILWKKLLDEGYDHFNVFQKCKALAVAIRNIVRNVQNLHHNWGNICLEDPSNSLVNSICTSMVIDVSTEMDFIRKYHRRGTMAVTIALLGAAKRLMMTLVRDENSLNALYGLPDIYPLRDQDLTKAARELYPTTSELDILGPLVKKVVLAEPLFRWVPPDGEKDALFQDLPTPLEELTDDIIRDEGMGDWLDPDHISHFWVNIRADEEVGDEVEEEGEENMQE